MRLASIRGAAASSALLMTLVCVAPATHAQTASDANNADNTAAGGLQEVLVTAQRREESVQRSSLAIAVVSSDALQQAGVTQAAELASIVPGLSISMAGAAVQTYIRGVGNTGTDANAESAIAYSINGVYISRPSGIGRTKWSIANRPWGYLDFYMQAYLEDVVDGYAAWRDSVLRVLEVKGGDLGAT